MPRCASAQQGEEEAFSEIAAASILLGDDVTSIRDYAFAYCPNLKQIVIPESVKEISIHAFDGCDAFVIWGIEGSYAESYAEENGFLFLSVKEA